MDYHKFKPWHIRYTLHNFAQPQKLSWTQYYINKIDGQDETESQYEYFNPCQLCLDYYYDHEYHIKQP